VNCLSLFITSGAFSTDGTLVTNGSFVSKGFSSITCCVFFSLSLSFLFSGITLVNIFVSGEITDLFSLVGKAIKSTL